ncbi:MAG: mechanosensitive ion channel domain-containing protein [Candidatus Deferrimicrobiaceae bacterium]
MVSANRKFLSLSVLLFLLAGLFVGISPVFSYGMDAEALSSGLYPSSTVLESVAERSLAMNVVEKSRFSEILDTHLFIIDERVITVGQLLMVLIVLFAGLLLLKQGIRLFRKRVLPKTTLKPNEAIALTKIIYYFGVLLILLFCMHLLHLPITAFAFLGGALAIGVGFGAQNLLNNFISGFIIMAERPIRLGDLIEIEGSFARVEDIGPRCTRIRTGDNIHILVPNSHFLEKSIVNWTLSDQKVRANVTVGVIYGSPVREVERLLVKAARENEKVLREPEPFVLFRDFGDNALIFFLYFWVTMETLTERLLLESNIRFRIDDLFREAGIVIAFPQRDIHLNTTQPLELKVVDSGGFPNRDEEG